MGKKASIWQNTLRIFRNLAMVGFIISFILPVDDNIPFGLLAAVFSLTSSISEFSILGLWAFMPNVFMSYLIFRFPTNKHWNQWFLTAYALITYWGVLLWFNHPKDLIIRFWKVDFSSLLQNLEIGYWVWNFSILMYLILALIENYSYTISLRKQKRQQERNSEED